jgi:hypothetical protein
MPSRLALFLTVGLACGSIAAADTGTPSVPAEDFATFKAEHLARLQKELACVEAASSFETMRACRPGPSGGHAGPPPPDQR